MGIVIDYTAAKLTAIADKLDNPEDVEVVLSILAEYFDGEIAIAWQDGGPVILPVSESDKKKGIPPGFAVMCPTGLTEAIEEEGVKGG